MTERQTVERLAGKLYVYRDEDRNAVAVNRWRIGPRGGMTADLIARMAVPDKHVSQEEIDAYGAKFAAAPDMYEALEALVKAVNTNELAAAMACHSVVSFANVEDALKPALAALRKARGESL